MSLIGPLQAQGLAVPELPTKARRATQGARLEGAGRAVQVTEYRPFFILGEVKNPGSYAYVPN